MSRGQKHHAAKVAAKRWTMTRITKVQAERTAKEAHAAAVRAVRS